MSINGIEAIRGFEPMAPIGFDAQTAGVGLSDIRTSEVALDDGRGFGEMVLGGIEQLSAAQNKSDVLATQAATGDLNALHQYTLAATEAQLTTSLTVAVRNKALEAFQEIMRTPVG